LALVIGATVGAFAASALQLPLWYYLINGCADLLRPDIAFCLFPVGFVYFGLVAIVVGTTMVMFNVVKWSWQKLVKIRQTYFPYLTLQLKKHPHLKLEWKRRRAGDGQGDAIRKYYESRTA
jgi:hypothetical protein